MASLSCRRVSKKQAAKVLAQYRDTSEQHASRAIDLAVQDYEDSVDLGQTQRGWRFIDTKRPYEGFRICTDPRVKAPHGRVSRKTKGKKMDREIIGGLIFTGVLLLRGGAIGYQVGKAVYKP